MHSSHRSSHVHNPAVLYFCNGGVACIQSTSGGVTHYDNMHGQYSGIAICMVPMICMTCITNTVNSRTRETKTRIVYIQEIITIVA